MGKTLEEIVQSLHDRAAALGNGDALSWFGREDIPQASAVIMRYTGYTDASEQVRSQKAGRMTLRLLGSAVRV